MLKAFKVRAYPNKTQQKRASIHFGNVRFVKNIALKQRADIWNAVKDIPKDLRTEHSCNAQTHNDQLPAMKQQFPFLELSCAQSLQLAHKEVHQSFKNFFGKKHRYPHFKSKHDRQSVGFPQRATVDFKNKTIYLPKIGHIKYRDERTFSEHYEIKTVKLIQETNGDYYISVLYETNIEKPELPDIKPEEIVGCDVGLHDLVVTNEGLRIPPPKFLRIAEEKIAYYQRILAKKKKGSQRYREIKHKINDLHHHVACQRDYWQHQIANQLVSENQGTCWEDLSIKNMVKNHCLAKSIHDAAWYSLKHKVKYKSAWQGKYFLECDKKDPTTKLCSCGHKQELSLGDRSWICEKCNAEHDRDVHAAENIKLFALAKFKKAQCPALSLVSPLTSTDVDVSVSDRSPNSDQVSTL